MKTLTDERIAIEQHVAESTHEQLADELENNCECLHDAKTVCNNARIRLPQAIEAINKAMVRLEMVDKPHDVTGPLAKAFEAITLTLHDMKTNVQPMPVSEKQVVRFMKDYVGANNIDHVSFQYTESDKALFFYCNNRNHSGGSSKSLSHALGEIKLEMSRLGEDG